MSDENWIGPDELRGIAAYCETLTPLWDAMTSAPKGGVSIDVEFQVDLRVFDANGEVLGRITWGDDGPAFYAGKGEASG